MIFLSCLSEKISLKAFPTPPFVSDGFSSESPMVFDPVSRCSVFSPRAHKRFSMKTGVSRINGIAITDTTRPIITGIKNTIRHVVMSLLLKNIILKTPISDTLTSAMAFVVLQIFARCSFGAVSMIYITCISFDFTNVITSAPMMYTM